MKIRKFKRSCLFVLTVCIFWMPDAVAESLADRFHALRDAAQSFDVETESVETPIDLKYRAAKGGAIRMNVLYRISSSARPEEPVHSSINLLRTFEESVLPDGNLKTVSQLDFKSMEDDSVRGKFTMTKMLHDGTKIISIMSDQGEFKGMWLEPASGMEKTALPKLEQKTLQEIASFVASSRLYSRTVKQGDQIFFPLLFGVGTASNNTTKEGRAPYLAGRVPCGGKTCLLVRFDEAMSSRADVEPSVTMTSSAKGYLILDEPTLALVKSLVWMRTTTVSARGEMISDVILQSERVD